MARIELFCACGGSLIASVPEAGAARVANAWYDAHCMGDCRPCTADECRAARGGEGDGMELRNRRLADIEAQVHERIALRRARKETGGG